MLKRLIEVALPLKEVSEQSAREKSIRHGHISTLHIWWARRPLAACRAVVFASLIPDPDDPECPESFRSLVNELLNESELQAEERRRFADRGYASQPLPGVHQASGQMGKLEQTTLHRTGPQADRRCPQDFCIPTPRAMLPRCWTHSPVAGRSRWRPCGWAARPTPST